MATPVHPHYGDKVCICGGEWKDDFVGWGHVVGTIIAVPGDPDPTNEEHITEYYFIQPDPEYMYRLGPNLGMPGGFSLKSLVLVEKVPMPERKISMLRRNPLPGH